VTVDMREPFEDLTFMTPLSDQRADRLVRFLAEDLHGTVVDTPIAVHEASLEEWDDFESGYSARYARWLAEHDPDDPDTAEVLECAARQRAGYFGGYRGILGMAYLSLVAV
jgi:hypothetical protein